MLKNEISIQHRVASAAFSPVTHVVATPRDAFSIHAANTAHGMQLHCATVVLSGHPVAEAATIKGPVFPPKGNSRDLPSSSISVIFLASEFQSYVNNRFIGYFPTAERSVI